MVYRFEKTTKLILGIDAANLRGGGGVTHLVELLRAADPPAHGFSKVILWSNQVTLSQVENSAWLEKVNPSELENGLLQRSLWQKFKLAKAAEDSGCDVLLVPGGSYSGNFQPFVTMSQNLLPFEWKEMRRYGLSMTFFKLLVLRFLQARTFKKANGMIFLTRYARDVVTKAVKKYSGKTNVIPHGVDERFRQFSREQNITDHYSKDKPFHILYVSIITVYKHQWHVAEAVASLRNLGLPVVLDLVGPAYPPALKRLKETIHRLDLTGQFIRYIGPVPYNELHRFYIEADMVLFASSCENMPNILLEGMASGLPIACANRGPMSEMLQDAGVYFDPEKPDEIANAIKKLMNSPILRSFLSNKSFKLSQNFTWKRCAKETFAFLAQIAGTHG